MPSLKKAVFSEATAAHDGTYMDTDWLPDALIALYIDFHVFQVARSKLARFRELEWLWISFVVVDSAWEADSSDWPALKHLFVSEFFRSARRFRRVISRMEVFLNRTQFPRLQEIGCRWSCLFSEDEVEEDWKGFTDRFMQAGIAVHTKWRCTT